MEFLGHAMGWLAGTALDLLLNFAVFWLMMDLISLVMEAVSRLLLGKGRGLFLSPTYNTIRWNLQKRERQKTAERAGRVRPIRRPAPPVPVPAAVTGKQTKTRQRPRSRPELSHHIGFRLADGREVWLHVSEGEYRRLAEGDRGQLTFLPQAPLPEGRYVSFLKDGEGVGGPGGP